MRSRILILLGLVILTGSAFGPATASGRIGGEVIADASEIFLLPFREEGSTAELTDDYDEPCSQGSTSPDGVFKYTNPTTLSQRADIWICSDEYDTKLFTYSTRDDSLFVSGCNDDASCGRSRYGSRLDGLLIKPGQTIYIVVDGSNGESGGYSIDMRLVVGACCSANGACSVATQHECVDGGGRYQGNDTSCDPNPCVAAPGACCFRNASCRLLTRTRCAAARGVFQGDGTVCNPSPCAGGPRALGDGTDDQIEEDGPGGETMSWGKVKDSWR